MFLYFIGTDAAGHVLSYDKHSGDDGPSTLLGRTCMAGDSDACTFSRTIDAVPEPSTCGMMAPGVAAIGALKRRRRRAGADQS